MDHEKSKVEIVAVGGIAALVNAMLQFLRNQGIQCVTCWALDDLLMSSSSCVAEFDTGAETSSRCTEAGGIQALVSAIQVFPRDASICFGACSCLTKLVQRNRESVQLSVKAGAIQAVSNMLVTSSNVKDLKMASKDLQQTAVSLMGHLTTKWKFTVA
jgi:tRNA G26 N,N-dimethylase Trm1